MVMLLLRDAAATRLCTGIGETNATVHCSRATRQRRTAFMAESVGKIWEGLAL